MKNSFVLYTDYMEQMELLDMTQRGVLFTAIMEYVSGGDLPDEMDNVTSMAFSFIKAQLDRDYNKYDETCEKRREAGRKGGLAKQANARSAKNARNGNLANLANQADNDNEDEDDNEDDKKNPLNNTYIHNDARAPIKYTMYTAKGVSE